MLLEITRLPFLIPPPTNVFCSISHSVAGGSFVIDSTNIEVMPDGTLVQPFDLNISAPGGTVITVRAKSNCGTINFDKAITVPADPTTTTTTTAGTSTTTTASTTTTTTAGTTTTTTAGTTTTTTAGTTTTTTTAAGTTTTTTAGTTTTTTTSAGTTTTTTAGTTTTTTTAAGTTTTTTAGTTTTTTTSAGTTTTTTAGTTTTTTTAAGTTTTTTAATTTTTTTAATTTTTTAGTTTTTTAGTTTTTTTAPPTSTALYLSGTDNGDNTFSLRWNVNRARLTGTKFKLVGMGSSTMVGTGATAPNNLPGYLQSWLTATTQAGLLLSFAVGGSDSRNYTAEGSNANVKVYQNVEAALTTRPHAAFISLPTNDIGAGVSVAAYVANLKSIWDIFMAYGVACFIETPQPRDSFSDAQQNQLLQAAQLIRDTFPHEYVVDVIEQLRDHASARPANIDPAYANGDFIHLNSAGHNIVANNAIAKMNAVFKDYDYVQYEIEYSTDNINFTIFDTVVGGTNIEKTYNRIDAARHYFRVRAKKTDGTYTPYTNVRSIFQPLKVINVNQTIQVNFGNNVDPAPPSDWNNLVGSVSAQMAAGTVFSALKDNLGNTTAIGITITKKFDAAVGNGANFNDVYPNLVMRNSWPARGGFNDYSQLKYTGLNPNWAYEVNVLTSYSTTPDVALGVRVRNQDDKQNFEFSANYPTNANPNSNKLIVLKGLIPESNGDLIIDMVPVAMNGNGYVNAIVLKRYATCPTVTDITASLTLSTGGGGS